MTCYYRRVSPDSYESTDLTRSNWTPEIQHGSPPLALLTREIEHHLEGSGLRIGRLVLDILGAIPVVPLTVRTFVPRPGKRISLVCAEMAPVADPDRPVARVSAWALATSDTSAGASDRYPPLVRNEAIPLPEFWWDAPGYLESVAWQRQQDEAGARIFWLRPTVALVDDEPTTALQRLAMVVDSANGIGSALNPEEFIFMNTDTTVHLHRLPTGDEFAVRARGSIGPDGLGVTTAEIFDHSGFIGTSAQTLLVQPR
ncbi:thioesterase family protein [[Mycobacterium] burgundiense]|uniref:Thioesterase family protein n=1 Tax=[Mycobacterium] burgundiense TaxID=3064286 RepID=A0ABN9NEP1_9MYCO|nr:thioesterase family protein [Mycolicibacterium sp. MU0053]CAJ1502291.1 thioesterase family protein [Mycolicibacterium sp. MU0053]